MARRIDVSLEGLKALLHRIERQELQPGDWTICSALVLQLITRNESQRDRMAAKLAEAARKASLNVVDAELVTDSASAPDKEVPPALPTGGESAQPEGAAAPGAAPEKKKAKGHGRNGAGAFVNAKHILYGLEPGTRGSLCPCCAQGNLTQYREKVIIRVVGQPLFAAEAHHHEQVHCRRCGKIIRAKSPPEVLQGIGTDYIVYDWSACAMLIVMHYFAAAPLKRLETLHASWGVPLPDANQWSLIDAADDRLLPLHRAMELHGVQEAKTLQIDDTGATVIELARQIQAEVDACELAGKSTKDVRKGVNATGVLLDTDEGRVVLFFTGRHHAGEVLDRLLQRRRAEPGRPRLVKVSDAASKNFDHAHSDVLIEAACNAHAFLAFRDIKDKHPEEYSVAGEVYKAVFDNDDKARSLRLNPTQRMLFHREHSKPWMEKLKAMCSEKLLSKLVEPRSNLWEPLSFIVNQWDRLTRFYEEPGVPLDSNLVEQTLIIPVRYLAASFNYKTETGAEVGDRMMSLIATVRANGVEPVGYLTHCLRHHEDLAKRPAAYLPWAYRQSQQPQAATGPPVATSAPATG